MKNWSHLIEQWQQTLSPEYERVLGQPAGASELEEISTNLRVKFPSEFLDLYSLHNGIGQTTEDGKLSWWFVPLEQIPELTASARSWFEDTHADLASRYFAFVDWGDGDTVGYLTDENGDLNPQLYEFEHDLYEFEDAQDWSEFLQKNYESIWGFLHTCCSDQ